ncbi:hypothetical protein ACHHYP_20491 [Achlya hypogyna]|uniref:RING-type domain-containing protein n=1 Tax=Achlya hypogyna TaxID=1202772 RepID=A0A1V9YKZ9_ACHHY|nr:hypothetical protein ACHHYP_20491 [Achlya hypogyna]
MRVITTSALCDQLLYEDDAEVQWHAKLLGLPRETAPLPPIAAAAPDPPTRSYVECPVCLDSASRPVATKCGHVFCEECFVQAAKHAKKCPVCRRRVNRNQLIRLFI